MTMNTISPDAKHIMSAVGRISDLWNPLMGLVEWFGLAGVFFVVADVARNFNVNLCLTIWVMAQITLMTSMVRLCIIAVRIAEIINERPMEATEK